MSRARNFTIRLASATLVVTSLMTMSSSTSIVPVAHATAGVWWVATTGTAADPSSDGSSCANPSFVGATDASIQEAIAAASAGEEVHICSGTYDIGTTVNVNKAITIAGSGLSLPILDGGGAHRIMTVGSGSVETITISRLHFRNAYVSEDHGASIRQDGNATLYVNTSLFTDNAVNAAHGAGIALIANANLGLPGSFHISGSTFFDNTAVDGAGAVVVGLQANVSTIENSTFVRNVASRGGGGANGSFASLSIANSTFIDNSAGDHGDAFWSASSRGLLIANTGAVLTSSQLCEVSGNVPVDNVSTDPSCLDIDGGDSVVSAAEAGIGQFGPWGSGVYGYSINAESAAIGAVREENCPDFDVRGVDRSGAPCDAGAFEFESGAPSITPSSSMALIKGRAIDPIVTFTSSGFAEPVIFRIASEISASLPGGVTFSTSTGRISGTPTESVATTSLIVTATDSLGKIANATIQVDNCTLAISEGKYLIADVTDLEVFGFGACGLEADYLQTSDINWNDEWQSAATQTSPFTGAFDGGGHMIQGLSISGGQTSFLPFIDNAIVENISLDVTVLGGYGSAGLARSSNASTISNVHIVGTVGSPLVGDDQGCIGGVVGEAGSTTLTNVSFIGTIDAPNGSWNGGIIGCSTSNSVINGAYVNGTIKGLDDVGGIVGWMGQASIYNSHATGKIVSTNNEIGGIVGWAEGNITDTVITTSYSQMEFEGTSNSTRVGAIAGVAPVGSVTLSFWQEGLSGVDGLNPVGWILDDLGDQPELTSTPLSLLETRATFTAASWAITDGWVDASTTDDVWGICESHTTPFLLARFTADPCAIYSTPTPDATPETSVPSTTTTTTTIAPTPTTVAPAITTIPPTTSTTVPNTTRTTTTIPAPVVYQGGVVVMLGSKKVNSTVAWNGNSKIEGTIGSIKMKLRFAAGATNTSDRGSIAVGGKFTVVLNGLKSESSASTGLSGKSLRLSKSTATAKGAVKVRVTIPKTAKVGVQKLRITVVNKDGKTVTLWFGVVIRR